jgi:hypothetical protein
MPAMGSAEEITAGETAEGSGGKQAADSGAGSEHDGQHTCAENLVLALGELNTQAKLPGAQAIGAAVTVHNAPPPLRLFRGIAVNAKTGALRTKPSNPGDMQKESFVRLRAERDLVIVMSACIEGRGENGPSDVNKIEAHFFVEDPQESTTKQRDRESKIGKSSAATTKPAVPPKSTQKSSKASSNATPPTTNPNAAKPLQKKTLTGPTKLAAASSKPKVSTANKLGTLGDGNGQKSNVDQNGKTEAASPEAKKERKKPRKLVRKEA